VGPLVSLWDIGGEGQRVPTDPEIAEALELVDYSCVRLSPDTREVFLPVRGMEIDLGGIAKGYAADEAERLLRKRGVERAIVDIGGNIVVIGEKTGGRPWRIGIQDPFQPRGAYFGIVELEDATAVTSGIYERYFEQDGERYHHILDTDTGYPVGGSLAGVTVVVGAKQASGDSPAADVPAAFPALAADALATGVFSMGAKAGGRLVERLSGVEAVLTFRDRQVRITAGLIDRFSLTSADFSPVSPP